MQLAELDPEICYEKCTYAIRLEGFTDATDSVKAGKQIQPKPFLGDVLTRENVADRRHNIELYI